MDVNFTPRGAASDRCATIVLPVWRTVGSRVLGQSLSLLATSKKSFSILHLSNANKKLIEKDQAVNYIQQKSQKRKPTVPYFKLCMKHLEIFPSFSNKKQSACDFVRPKKVSLHFLHVFIVQINPTSMALC